MHAHEELVLGETHFKPTGEGSGLLGMPGDMTPTSRFVRTMTLANFTAAVKPSKEAIKMAYQIVNTVDIAHRVILTTSTGASQTAPPGQWLRTSGKKALYFRT